MPYRSFRLRCLRCALSWLVILAGMSLISRALRAQTQLPEAASEELKKVPAHSPAVSPQLFALDWLPQPQWKMHLASLPHGEAKAAFPLAAFSWETTYEIPYGTITRPTTRNNSWESARFEVSALRWADLGDGQHGFSLLNESKYGYGAKRNTLRLTLLRSPKSPDPEADQRYHHFGYSLYPHSADGKQSLTVRPGYEFNYTLEAFQAAAQDEPMGTDHSYINLACDNVVLTAMKKTEDREGLLLRLFEWAGKSGNTEITGAERAVSAQLTNLREAPYGNEIQMKNSKGKIQVHPFEIVSVRVNHALPTR